jgi:hypothetical protein
MPDFANGCEEVARFFSDVAQHFLFAQHPGLHAFSLATFDKMHVRAESGVATNGSASAMTAEIIVLVSTASTL